MALNEKEEVDTVLIENSQEKKRNLVRIISVTILVILFVIVIGIRVNNPDLIQLSTLVIIMGVVLLVGVFAFFSFEIFQKFENLKKKVASGDKIPPPSPEEDIIKRLHKLITNDQHNGFQNHIMRYASTTQNINQNIIYVFRIELLYPDKQYGKKPYVLINANYINNIPAVIPENIKRYDLQNNINSFSTKPYSTPDVEETVTENPILGTRSVSKRTTHKKKEDLEIKKEKKDIG